MSTIVLRHQYLAAQLTRDRRAALRVLLEDGLGAGVSVPELYLEVIQPAQYEIGRLWQANALSVAEEHVATGISQLALTMLYPSISRAAPIGKQVMVACVGTERHDLGARMVADFYEMAGFSVRYLGANVGAEDLIVMVKEDPPDVLALSVTLTANVKSLRLAVDGIRAAVGDQVTFAVGGPASGALRSSGAPIQADVADLDVRAAVEHSAALLRSAK